ncbi:MAG: hypothetical protein K6T81_14515 [Alicyclobacillus macrosporangiidus]|uniref:hypothetical protein n=1 Tax=Alicyclobacillus macrosporangiidus TaxID=392015 RepID=UPI0026E98842|nr:hypothetical protein [Alicyclobacillus macrosporangiidus]MCL6599929.1 hypothetical protein [Alicyclobacillus macrosporangiidus]
MSRDKKKEPMIENLKVRIYGKSEYAAGYRVTLPKPPKPAKPGRRIIQHGDVY